VGKLRFLIKRCLSPSDAQLAKVPELKSKPKRALIVIMSAFASGFLMVLVAFVREFGAKMNDEDRTRWQELKRMLPLPRRFREDVPRDGSLKG